MRLVDLLLGRRTTLHGVGGLSRVAVAGRVESVRTFESPASGVEAALLYWRLWHLVPTNRRNGTIHWERVIAATYFFGHDIVVACESGRLAVLFEGLSVYWPHYEQHPWPSQLPGEFTMRLESAAAMNQNRYCFQEVAFRVGDPLRVEGWVRPRPARQASYREQGRPADFTTVPERGWVTLSRPSDAELG